MNICILTIGLLQKGPVVSTKVVSMLLASIRTIVHFHLCMMHQFIKLSEACSVCIVIARSVLYRYCIVSANAVEWEKMVKNRSMLVGSVPSRARYYQLFGAHNMQICARAHTITKRKFVDCSLARQPPPVRDDAAFTVRTSPPPWFIRLFLPVFDGVGRYYIYS